jgi:signal recognition particle subunit SRP54
MTSHEKDHPEILNASRRRRIATGSGTSVQDVNQLLKQFQEMKKSMKQMASMMKNNKKRKGFKFPFMG